MEPTPYEQEEEINIREYAAILIKRRWTLAAVFALVVLVGTIATFTATPIYLAQSTIIIEKENPNLLSIQEVLSVDATDTDYYQTQYQIIESRAVAREVVERLGLEASEEFNPPPPDHFLARTVASWKAAARSGKQWIANLLNRGPAEARSPAEGPEPDAGIVNAFLGRVQVEPVRNSRMVKVGVEAADPALAASMANELVSAFIDQNLEIKLRAAKDAVQWLAQRVDEERAKVEAAEMALLRYKEENGITSSFSSETEQIATQQLSNLEEQVIEARSARVEAETRYHQAAALANAPDALDAIPEVMRNDLVQEVKRIEVELYNRLSEYSGKYGANHPRMVAVKSELKELEKRKRNEVLRVVQALRNEYQLALAREDTLEKALEEQKAQNMALSKKAVQLSVLQRQAESSRHMYELLINRFKETSLTEEMRHGNVRVVDPAEVPAVPVKPKKKRNLLLAVVLGLMAGVGLCFFIDYLDNSIKLPDEVKSVLGISYLGPIPAVSEIDSPRASLVVRNTPRAPVAESFRGIRTGIQYASADGPPRVLLVASADRGEGKTFVAANLAVTLAQGGARVVLIDCDMRKPRIHKVFGLARQAGVSAFLTGKTAFDTLACPTLVAGLDAIPCGTIPPNPSELLNSSRMRALIKTLGANYEYVIVDSPPLSAVADAAILAPVVDATLLVVRAGETPQPIIKSALSQLRSVHANVLGAVLNGVVMGRGNYYYYQYYYDYDGDGKTGSKNNRRRQASIQADAN